MTFVQIEKYEFKQAFADEYKELRKKRVNGKSKLKNDREDQFEYGLEWAEGRKHYFSVACRHVTRRNPNWHTQITSGPSSFSKRKGVYEHYNLSLPDFLAKKKKKYLAPHERLKHPDVKVMAYEHVSGMYEGLKKLTIESADKNGLIEFLIVDDENKQLLATLGFARHLFYERLKAAKVGEEFKYRRKLCKIDPEPYLDWPTKTDTFTIF